MPDEAGQRVTLVDPGSGTVVGSKVREDVDRTADALSSVYVHVVTPSERLALQVIPQKDASKKLYGGLLGSTAAALVLEGEDPDDAAVRTLQRELFVSFARPESLGWHLFKDENGAVRRRATYVWKSKQETLEFDPKKIGDLTYMDRPTLEKKIANEPEAFAASFLDDWKHYGEILPF